MLFYNPGFGKAVRLGYVKVKWLFRPIAKMCKFKRFGGGSFLSFPGGGEPPRHGPAPNQSKILATPINWRLPKKLFWRPFFLENTCGCVLGPWPWLRAFLSLASRGSVHEKTVLGLGIFCGLGLGPCVLDSTSANLFFKVILSRKNLRGGGRLLLKNGTIDGYAL